MNRRMKSALVLLLVAGSGFGLAGCHSKKAKPTEAPKETVSATTPPASTGGTSTDTGSVRQLSQTKGDVPSSEGVIGATVRFDYDSSEIKAEYAPIITAQAKRLSADRHLALRLEGNTDERGSAEYNIALGERRAQAVKKALMLQGANENQLSTVSYGEERPVADGHDEASWAQNRRVDIVVIGGR